MRYCKKCVMPDTRPGLIIDEDGICIACKHHEQKNTIDWDERWKELENLANKYRGCNGNYYDCIITASSGKDSYYQLHIFKEKLKMNPLVVSVGNFTSSKTGIENWDNMLNEFGVDAIQLTLNPRVCKHMFLKGLKKGIPTWYFDKAIYSWPLKIATQMKIPLVVYGENINYEYGGLQSLDTPSAKDQLQNDVVKPIPVEDWIDNDIKSSDFAPCLSVSKEELEKLEPIYLSYYIPWSGYGNMQWARTRGFKTLDDTREWKREGFIEQYDQIDTIGYLVHSWFKFPKLGHSRTTDIASLWIREGRISREKAVEKVIEEDWKLDRKMLNDFIKFIGISESQFWKIVDKWANRDIVEKQNENWVLKKNVKNALKNGEEVK